ncbi:Initiation-specific alpha-1,6-mannosyltransferase [Colletotrichum sidae]|uniref:Initiation-specific alpha-1,6-mannosyltransferase n=1 Tax=Colletotrichum sidae TaxID=1347389 RepID=A0A4R8TE38_9PEZI|nr:Initiation-specific alpha-1,6-mannosyltransferase [Colletotrichum sidae]
MAKPESPSNTLTWLRERITHHLSRLRYRTCALTGLVLILLSMFWLYGTGGVHHLKLRFAGDRFAHLEHSTWNDNSTRSDWVRPKPGHLIPPKIWQIMLPKDWKEENPHNDPKKLKETASWLALNTDYTYTRRGRVRLVLPIARWNHVPRVGVDDIRGTQRHLELTFDNAGSTLVGGRGGQDFVRRRFGNDSRILQTYNSLPNVGMKSDLLRYLLLDVEGGVYTDTDTVALRPIDGWVPRELRSATRLVVGIEFDQRDGPPWVDIPHPLQFCQWTIAAAPGHPVFAKMARRALAAVEDLAREHGVPARELRPTSFEVMNSTGPAAWTDVVWEHLRTVRPELADLRDLSYMEEPTLYGDVLVLPIDGFGMGQGHSGSTNDGSVPEDALVQHRFGGSWRDSN